MGSWQYDDLLVSAAISHPASWRDQNAVSVCWTRNGFLRSLVHRRIQGPCAIVLVPYLKLWGLLTQTSGNYSQPATCCSLIMKGKLSIGLFSPSSISFNENAIVRNFYLHPSKLIKDSSPTLREFAYDHLWLWNLTRHEVEHIILITA